MLRENDVERKVRLWEQHGQSILLFIITASLAWTAKTLWEANANAAALTADVRAIREQVSELKGTMSAIQAQYVTRGEFLVHEQRIQSLEAKRQ